ncbi:unnamed protein product [Rotaria sp. Silwood2]|nr:unnamed protein product [Rotaria sp. Silwood2]CAF4593701.1 unnamed protein product [Rotaria sp. Silwood2]
MAKDCRPQWIVDSHIKDIDLHGYQSIDLALDKVRETLSTAKKHELNSYKFIPGRGTHSEVNEFDRKYKETKNWKRKVDSRLLEAVRDYLKTVINDFHVYEMPAQNKSTEIYVRFNGKKYAEKNCSSSSYLSDDLLPQQFESDNDV